MQRLVGFALRRVRLLTVVALVAVPWLILRYDFGWQSILAGASGLLLVVVAGAAMRHHARRAGTGEE